MKKKPRTKSNKQNTEINRMNDLNASLGTIVQATDTGNINKR